MQALLPVRHRIVLIVPTLMDNDCCAICLQAVEAVELVEAFGLPFDEVRSWSGAHIHQAFVNLTAGNPIDQPLPVPNLDEMQDDEIPD